MTRTERASYPRALRKDRSEPKNAMNKRIPKQGAGPHNWGAIDDQLELESAAEADEEVELEREGGMYNFELHSTFTRLRIDSYLAVKPGEASEEVPRPSSVGSRRASSGSLTDEEREKARLTRLHAMARDGKHGFLQIKMLRLIRYFII